MNQAKQFPLIEILLDMHRVLSQTNRDATFNGSRGSNQLTDLEDLQELEDPMDPDNPKHKQDLEYLEGQIS